MSLLTWFILTWLIVTVLDIACCIHLFWGDYRQGVGIIVRDVVLFSLVSLCPIVNIVVLIAMTCMVLEEPFKRMSRRFSDVWNKTLIEGKKQ